MLLGRFWWSRTSFFLPASERAHLTQLVVKAIEGDRYARAALEGGIGRSLQLKH